MTVNHGHYFLCRYDKDGSGSIEIDEMVEIVGNLFEMEGLSKVIQQFDFCRQADKLLNLFDVGSEIYD